MFGIYGSFQYSLNLSQRDDWNELDTKFRFNLRDRTSQHVQVHTPADCTVLPCGCAHINTIHRSFPGRVTDQAISRRPFSADTRFPSVLVVFVVNKASLGQVFIRVLWFLTPNPHYMIVIQQLCSHFRLQSCVQQGKREKPGTLAEIIVSRKLADIKGRKCFSTHARHFLALHDKPT